MNHAPRSSREKSNNLASSFDEMVLQLAGRDHWRDFSHIRRSRTIMPEFHSGKQLDLPTITPSEGAPRSVNVMRRVMQVTRLSRCIAPRRLAECNERRKARTTTTRRVPVGRILYATCPRFYLATRDVRLRRIPPISLIVKIQRANYRRHTGAGTCVTCVSAREFHRNTATLSTLISDLWLGSPSLRDIDESCLMSGKFLRRRKSVKDLIVRLLLGETADSFP